VLPNQRDQRDGAYPGASRLLFMPGIAPPQGGPDHILREATDALRVVHEVTTPAEARTAVRGMAAQGLGHVKIWVDDRNGTYPKLAPAVYGAVIDEAHARKMLVHAHAIQAEDQKAVLAAGADVLVHMVQRQPLDDALLGLVKAKRPYWATSSGSVIRRHSARPTRSSNRRCRPRSWRGFVRPPNGVLWCRAAVRYRPPPPIANVRWR
jgi:hypothetical protein